jgi:thioredoxin 1
MKPVSNAPIRSTAAQLERILAAEQPTLVVFETPGCEPCQSLAVSLDELAREFAGRVRIVRVEDARQGWLAARYHLVSVPTLLFWNAGEKARIRGNPGIEATRRHLEFLLTGGTRPDPASGPRHTLEASFDSCRPRASRTAPLGRLAPPRSHARGGIL